MKIIAIDPGGLPTKANSKAGTGICIATVSKDKIVEAYTQTIEWDERFYFIDNMILSYSPKHIIVEDFLLYNSHSRTMINNRFFTVRFIGVIEYIAITNNISITFQTASEVNLVKCDIETETKHEQMAYKHMKLWWIKNVKI